MTKRTNCRMALLSCVAILAGIGAPSVAQRSQPSAAVAVPSYEPYATVVHHALPAWSPDDREILYTAIGGVESQHLYTVGAAGGTSRRKFQNDVWSAAAAWSRDGSRIALAWQGADGKHIWTIDSKGGDFKQVTRGSGAFEHAPSWSADGQSIVFASSKSDPPPILIAGIDGSSVAPFAFGFRPRYSPDGKSIAFTARVPGFGSTAWAVYIKGLAGGSPRLLWSTKGEIKAWPSGADWSSDGQQIAFIRQLPIGSELLIIDVATDRVVHRISLEGPAHDPAWSHDGKQIAFELETTNHPGEIHAVRLDQSSRDIQVTRQAQQGSSRLVSYRSADGVMIPAFLFEPKDRGKRRAALIWIHGGEPGAGSFEDTFHADLQYFVDQGFVVLAPNYRGSAGGPSVSPGYDSADAMVSDIEAGARFLTETAAVDGRRIGLVGFSFGGYLSLLTAAKTGRSFAAVVDFFGPTDLAELYRDAAPYRPVLANRLGGTPDDHAERYRKLSPLTFADRINPPVLILHGAADQKVSIQQSIRMAAALKAAGKEVSFLRLPSGHGFSAEDNMKAFPKVARFLAAKLHR